MSNLTSRAMKSISNATRARTPDSAKRVALSVVFTWCLSVCWGEFPPLVEGVESSLLFIY